MNKVVNLRFLLPYLLLQLIAIVAYSQPADFSVSLATVDAGLLNKKNLFDFQVTSGLNTPKNVLLKGTVKYRSQPYRIYYSLKFLAQPGVNNIAEHAHRAVFEYSSTSVKELLELFDRLPEGTLQYCVTLHSADGESTFAGVEDCTFGKNEDLFLINLIDPENKAELYELNPMLSWVANYPFASSLAYKIKVVEMKKDQNAINAVKRNNPVYEEKGLMQMSINYPIYAKPLQVGNTYAWTVDAYYKDLLLGGAEPWQFTIVEDSILKSVSLNPAYIDLEKESGIYQLYAPGIIKIKYVLKDLKSDSLNVTLFDRNKKAVPLPKELKQLNAIVGDNRFELDLKEHLSLSHMKDYVLHLVSATGKTYQVPFKYVNPDLIK